MEIFLTENPIVKDKNYVEVSPWEISVPQNDWEKLCRPVILTFIFDGINGSAWSIQEVQQVSLLRL